MRKSQQTDQTVTDLVQASLGLGRLSDLSTILKFVANRVGARGCILWERGPDLDAAGPAPRENLRQVAQWFDADRYCDLASLTIDTSAVGWVASHGRARDFTRPGSQPCTFEDVALLHRLGVEGLYATPATFPNGADGVVATYRSDASLLPRVARKQVDQLARVVPGLYQSVRDRISLDLLRSVTDVLSEADRRARGAALSQEEMIGVVQKVAELISAAFQCLETSIFFESPSDAPGVYTLQGTTWPWRGELKTVRHTASGPGLTGWVLRNSRPLMLFDLSRFKRGREIESARYPDLTWSDSFDIEVAVRRFNGWEEGHELPPLSFLAAPITIGERVLGVVRCSVPLAGPYYFTERDLSLLQLVAARLGQFQGAWLSRREVDEENRSWHALYKSVNGLNTMVQQELTHETPDERRILKASLRAAVEVFPGAEILAVRLLREDETGRFLSFEVTHGAAWEEGDAGLMRQHLEEHFPVDEKEPTSAGAYVVRTGRAHVADPVQGDRYNRQLFPQVRRALWAPINLGDRVVGVLDVGVTTDDRFPREVERIGELLGQQLGLYHHLLTTIARLRQAEDELRTSAEAQRRIFEDQFHQLSSPLIQAHARVDATLRENRSDGGVDPGRLLPIRGLLAKTKRVALASRLFAALSRPGLGPIPIRKAKLRLDQLRKMLVEGAADTELLIEEYRAIRFRVDRKTIETHPAPEVQVDHELLEQAVYTILDNAGKYSYSATEVRIYVGLTGAGRFHISVMNRGVRIAPREVRQAVTRGWRGDLAQLTTGEGSGIGLWIVDNIMRAHDGELIINATNSDGWTDVKLVFPVGK